MNRSLLQPFNVLVLLLVFVAGHVIAQQPPRLLRFISASGQPCMGRLISADEGVPSAIENLGATLPELCGRVDDAGQLQQIITAFAYVRSHQPLLSAVETIPAAALGARILAPVQVTQQSLQQSQRIILAAALNYSEERGDTDVPAAASADALLLFPKSTSPTGAYQNVPLGYRLGSSEPVALLDYQVELALLLLQDIDLAQLPDEFVFSNAVAYMLANNLSDREPSILAPETGYLQGNSHPGYLPLGPWMIHGSDLDPRWRQGGRANLTLSLLVQDAGRYALRTEQQGMSSQMLFNGYRLLQILADRYKRGKLICMRDQAGQQGSYHDAQGRLPAGSLILTGTPAGTAMKRPSLTARLLLLLDSGFSPQRARELFLQQQLAAADSFGYLQTGDLVYSAISSLGRQRWLVVANAGVAPLTSKPDPACPDAMN